MIFSPRAGEIDRAPHRECHKASDSNEPAFFEGAGVSLFKLLTTLVAEF